jgi:hypothetical protein
MMVRPHSDRPLTSVGIGSVGCRSMPTIRPQIASPQGSIATTPCPFAVDQVPTGEDVRADANGATIAIATAAMTDNCHGDFRFLSIARVSDRPAP